MSPSIEEIERLLEQAPDDYLLLTTLGKEYVSAGEYERAVETLSKVIDLNPDYSVAYRYLAEAFQKEGDREGAVKTYEDGIRVAETVGDIQTAKEMRVFLGRLERRGQ